MVMRSFTRNNRLWLVAAIAWHALVDAVAVVSVTQVGAVATEAIIAVMAAISLAVIFLLKEEDPPKEQRPEAPDIDFEPAPVNITAEKIDDSRYSS
jgi:predicted anti-sigma-YlaC factor YlaD